MKRQPKPEPYHKIPVVRVNPCNKEEVLIYNDPGLRDTYVKRSEIAVLIRRLQRMIPE